MVTLLERDSFSEPEIEIFKCIAKWCSSNKDENDLVMQRVRLNCLTNEEIITIVRPTKLVDDEKLFSVLAEIVQGMPKITEQKVTTVVESRGDSNLCSSILQCFNTDLCSPLFKAKFISGTNTDILLLQNQSSGSYAYHNIGNKNGITLIFNNSYYINHVCIKFWQGKRSNYSYYIEVSLDRKNWKKVVDYSTYSCRSVQNVFFEKVGAQYIRVVGTFSSVENALRMTCLKVHLKSHFPKMIDGIICPEENVALMEKGAVVIAPKKNKGSEYLLSHQNYLFLNFMEKCIVQLAQPYIISNINISFCKPGFKFLIQTSVDKYSWTIAVDFQHVQYNAKIGYFSFDARPTLFIKIIGFSNNSSAIKQFWCNDLQCYWTEKK